MRHLSDRGKEKRAKGRKRRYAKTTSGGVFWPLFIVVGIFIKIKVVEIRAVWHGNSNQS